MSAEPDPPVVLWQAFPGERISWADYESVLADAGVHMTCVTLIPGRCGSTLFGHLVNQWGGFGIGRESFNERRQAAWKKNAGSSLEFFSWVFRNRAAGGVFWFQAAPHRHDHLLRGLDPAIPRTWRYSVILRRDIVAQAMSYVYAINSEVWHSSSPEFDPSKPMALPGDVRLLADQVFDWIGRLVGCEVRIREILTERGEECPLVLFYEDIVRDPREAVLRFYREAGVPLPSDPPPLRPTLSRLQKSGETALRDCLLSRYGDQVRQVEDSRAAGILAWADGVAMLKSRTGRPRV